MKALISASLLPETATSLAIDDLGDRQLVGLRVLLQFRHRRVRVFRLRPSSAAR